jgi:hypothetical protein
MLKTHRDREMGSFLQDRLKTCPAKKKSVAGEINLTALPPLEEA